MLIGDSQAHPVEPALLERSQELDPERAGLDLADVETDHLANAGLVHRIGDDHRLGHDPAMVAHLDLFGVNPQIRVRALQRSLPERLDPLIERPAHGTNTILGHPVDPQLLDQPVHLPRRDPVDVRLEHDGHDRLLRAPPRLQERREVRPARALLRDQQLDLTNPRLPRPGAIPVAMRQPRLGRDLTERSADLSGNLAFHQLPGDQRDRLTNEILKPTIHRLGDDIGNRHPLTFGHRGVLLHVGSLRTTRRVRRRDGRPLRAVDLPDARYTTSTDMTAAARARPARGRAGIGTAKGRSTARRS